MKKNLKRITISVFVLFLLIQTYQPAHNSDSGQVSFNHISQIYNMPDEVESILKTSCYDCHSNNTNYPWYSQIQPIGLLLERDIEQGKKNLNFSEFGSYSKRKQQNKLASIAKQIKKGEMPLPIYTIIHKEAELTSAQKERINTWIATINKKKIGIDSGTQIIIEKYQESNDIKFYL